MRQKEFAIQKNSRFTLKIILYLFAMAVSFFLLCLILITGHQKMKPSAVMIGIWCLFFLFCCYKIHWLNRKKHTEQLYQKGTLSVTELDHMDGIDFEELACDILVANGFEVAENTQASCDYGVDILAWKDGMSYAIQCKRYGEPVGLEAVQQVYAGRAYYECHAAVVLTNQTFTANAWKLADKIGVVLWDRETLRHML